MNLTSLEKLTIRQTYLHNALTAFDVFFKHDHENYLRQPNAQVKNRSADVLNRGQQSFACGSQLTRLANIDRLM